MRPENRDHGKHAEPEIEQKYAQHDGMDAEASIRRALIEMAPMGLPDRFARERSAQEREGGIGEIIEREQDRRRQMAARRQMKQQPGQQQADREAADVAKEQARDRLVERSKSDDCAEERHRHRERRCRYDPKKA